MSTARPNSFQFKIGDLEELMRSGMNPDAALGELRRRASAPIAQVEEQEESDEPEDDTGHFDYEKAEEEYRKSLPARVDPRLRPLAKVTVAPPGGDTRSDDQADASVQERCKKRYGFYDPRLVLAVNPKTGKVTIKPNVLNCRVILENMKGFDLRFSIFEQCELLNGAPLTDVHIKRAREEIVRLLGTNVVKADVADAIEVIADFHRYNPLKDWFEELPTPEGSGHLDRWLFDICGCPVTEINRIIGRKWLISAVARALDPGCYVEGSLILYGPQGAGKSWLFRNLNPRPEYYCGEELNISNKKEAAAVCAGKFIIELAELNSIRRNHLNAMKQYLTEQSDTYQPKYKQKAITVPRMHIFGGSTNDETFLTDSTGNRRFWCVAAGEKVDQEGFLAIKEQLWAEALAAYRAGERWTLTDEERGLLEEANEQFKVEEPLVAFLDEALEKWSDEFLTTNRLLHEVLQPYKEKVYSKALASAMQTLGWKKAQATSGPHKGRKGYQRPPGQAEEEQESVW